MIKVTSRGDLDKLRGARPATRPEPAPAARPAPAPAPAPATPAPAIDTAQIASMQAAISAMAVGIERTAELVAQSQQAAPKKMSAIIHRDAAGKMERVEITVTN